MFGWRLLPTVLAASVFLTGPARGADWPCYNADASRSATTEGALSYPLRKAWEYTPAQPPRPAWPEPGKEIHRIDFDYAPQPVVAAGKVFFGSTADDTLRALDLATGRIVWTFTSDAPLRFAPAFAEGRLYVPSDDGHLYCLQAADGALLWKFRAAPADDQLLGNGRMISRWPLRAGVVVVDGTVYTAAGMWPSEGIYLYALKADSGDVVWQNDTSGNGYISTPHPGAGALTGVAPQGYLLANKDVLLVPTGRSVPAVFDRHTGRLLYYHHGAAHYNGGSWATIAGDLFFNEQHPRGKTTPSHVGEAEPIQGDGLIGYRIADGNRSVRLQDKHRIVVGKGVAFASGKGHITATEVAALAQQGRRPPAGMKWKTPHGRTYSLALAGGVLVAGGRGTVTLFDPVSGKQSWQTKVDGQVRGLAVADGRLIATTNKGAVICYAEGSASARPKQVTEKITWRDAASAPAVKIIRDSGKKEGYALVVSRSDCRLAEALARKTKLHVVSLLTDPDKVPAERKRLLAGAPYGSRIVVHGLANPKRLPYAPYFADLVVVAGDVGQLPGAEIYRMLRPCGGVLCVSDVPAATAAAIVKNASIPKSEVQSATRIVRGPLPGAGEWRHQWADAGRTGGGTDKRVRLPLRLLWFGGPGPDRMTDRHWGSSTPLSVAGRVFVTGQHDVIAFDAYNGRELWNRKMPGAGRSYTYVRTSNSCADADAVYVVVGTQCHRLDQATGRTLKTYTMPKIRVKAGDPKVAPRWGYVAVTDKLLLGSMETVKAAGEAAAVFALSKSTGAPVWNYKAKDLVSNTSIAVGRKRLFLIDATSNAMIQDAARRGERIKPTGFLQALDLARGKPLWKKDDAPLRRRCVQVARGLVLVDGGTAYKADDGTPVWNRRFGYGRQPLICGDWIVAPPQAYDLRTGEPRMTTDLLTGKPKLWRYARAYGCNAAVGCENLLMYRSGTVGFMDMMREGVTNFGGVKPGCGVTTIPAAGLMIHVEGSSGCTCGYNYQTCLALVPAQTANTPWYVLQNLPPSGLLQQLSVNFGAPGDRRDGKRAPWLGYPRPDMPEACPAPMRITVPASKPAYYQLADSPAIAKTDRPWVYTSGLRGAGRIDVDLMLFPRRPVVAQPVTRAPKLDGKPDEACWKKAVPMRFAEEAHLLPPRTTVLACRDKENLYFAFRRESAAGAPAQGPRRPRRPGAQRPNRPGRPGMSPRPWVGEGFDIQLTDGRRRVLLVLGVSRRGGQYGHKHTWQGQQWDTSPRKGQRPGPRQTQPNWTSEWTAKVDSNEKEWTAEVAVPLKAIDEAGIVTKRLELNILVRANRRVRGRPIGLTPFWTFGLNPPRRPGVLMPVIDKPVPVPKRKMTVVLHFAEPEDVAPGRRVFDVAIQGKTVLRNLDIVKAAGGPHRALVKSFSNIPAEERLTVELVPAGGAAALPPVICAVEVRAQK